MPKVLRRVAGESCRRIAELCRVSTATAEVGMLIAWQTVNAEAWETLNSDTSRPFEKPQGGRIAVKVISHLGNEVMKVFRV